MELEKNVVYVVYRCQIYDEDGGRAHSGIWVFKDYAEAVKETASRIDCAAASACGLGVIAVFETDELGYGNDVELERFNREVGVEFDKLYPEPAKVVDAGREVPIVEVDV